MEFMDKRATPRLDISLAASFQHRKGKVVDTQRIDCHVQNVSAGGVCFCTEDELQRGDQFLLTITLSDNSGELHLFGDVVWQSPLNEELYQTGARLYNEHGEQDDHYAAIVTQMLADIGI